MLAELAIISSLLVLHGANAERGVVLRHHSIEAPYITDWWQEGIPHWEISGDTVVTNHFIRLTPEKSSRRGAVWNKIPYPHKNFELRARFLVRSKRNPGADGIGFWYVANKPVGATQPAETTLAQTQTGEHLFGMEPDFRGVGVIFDSYDNDYRRDNPATSIVINDGTSRQWDLANDLFRDARARCSFDHRNAQGQDPIEMTLTYINKKLTLRLRSYLRHIDIICGEVDNVELPVEGYFGVTASTGAMVDNHDLVSVEVRQANENEDGTTSSQNAEDRVEHFDHTQDAIQKSFWGKQERRSGRPRHSEAPGSTYA